MDTIQKILTKIKKSKGGVTADLLEKELGFSRQYIVRLLNRLMSQGKINRQGKTRAAKYYPGYASDKNNHLELVKERQGLSEYTVFEEVIRRMQLNTQLNKNCLTIFDYAFTEMLNNAIDRPLTQQESVDQCRNRSHKHHFYH